MSQVVLIVSATNRPSSNAFHVARFIEELYKSIQVPAELFSLKELDVQIFDSSSYATKSPILLDFQLQFMESAGLHVVTPEYTGSYPGVLKYFIDLLELPKGFDHKPIAFVGESNGSGGAQRAVEHLQDVFQYRKAHIFPDRVFIPEISKRLDPEGKVIDTAVVKRLTQQVADFAQYIKKLSQ